MKTSIPIKTVLLSVFDKTGLEPVIEALKTHGVKVYSTQGTGKFLSDTFGIDVVAVESITNFPEMMEGRVKTLHPRIFGGILARREGSNDVAEAKEHGVPLFDAVIANLYPFWDHVNDDLATQSSFVDIGGPSMLRAASKNFRHVTVVSHPDDYAEFVAELTENKGETTESFRHKLAARTFSRTAAYDSLIASTWTQEGSLPSQLNLTPKQELRYGENPHQQAQWCGEAKWTQIQGKALSYNNLLDTEAAWRLANEFNKPCFVVVKHNNPCGVAAGNEELSSLWQKALGADPKSAFGGIVACSRTIDGASAKQIAELFAEVVIATEFSPEALEIFKSKKNLRLLSWPTPTFSPFEVRASLGGWLVQESDNAGVPSQLNTVTKTVAPEDCMEDLKFAWLVCKHVRSNAIVFAKNGVTIGIGAGQMSRVDAVEIARSKAGDPSSASLSGSVMASDAFFPFRDNIDALKGLGIRAVIQPGGSKRDAEVIDACNEQGIAMVFTGERHFKH